MNEVSEKVSKLKTVKIENYNIFRLMNPYEGRDKEFYHSKKGCKSWVGAFKFYDDIKNILEKELGIEDFIYLRGEQTAGRFNSYGIMLISDEALAYATGFIESITISDGTNIDHFWLKPFDPPHGSFIKARIDEEVERVKKEGEMKIKKLGAGSQKL